MGSSNQISQPKYKERIYSLEEYRVWLQSLDIHFAQFVTYTQPHFIEEGLAQRKFRIFSDHLRKSLFPVSNPPLFRQIAAMERDANGRLHFHVLYEAIQPHKSRTIEEENERFRWIALKEWRRQFPSARIDAQMFEDIYDKAGLIDYITKEFEKRRLSNFDFLTV